MKLLKKMAWIMCFGFLFQAQLFSQEISISGNVTSFDNGQPVIGANVFIKGTTIGTITDIDGNFAIKAGKDDVLVFSFVGFDRKEVAIDDQNFISVMLNSSVESISELE